MPPGERHVCATLLARPAVVAWRNSLTQGWADRCTAALGAAAVTGCNCVQSNGGPTDDEVVERVSRRLLDWLFYPPGRESQLARTVGANLRRYAPGWRGEVEAEDVVNTLYMTLLTAATATDVIAALVADLRPPERLLAHRAWNVYRPFDRSVRQRDRRVSGWDWHAAIGPPPGRSTSAVFADWLARLEDEERRVVDGVLAGQSPADLAQQTGRSVRWVYQRIQGAIKKLLE